MNPMKFPITYAECIVLTIHYVRGFQSFRCHGPPNMINLVRGTPILKLNWKLYINLFKDPIYAVKNCINLCKIYMENILFTLLI